MESKVGQKFQLSSTRLYRGKIYQENNVEKDIWIMLGFLIIPIRLNGRSKRRKNYFNIFWFMEENGFKYVKN